MKKMKMIWALALLAAGFALVLGGCSNGSSGSGSGGGAGGSGGGAGGATVAPKFADVTEIKLEPNSTYNNQAVVTFLADDNEWGAKTGNKVTFTIVAEADSVPTVEDKELKGFLVDNTADAGWWGMLTSYANSGTDIDDTEEKTYELSFTVTADASSAAPGACKLGLYIGNKETQDDTRNPQRKIIRRKS